MFPKFKTIQVVSGSWPPEICGVGDFMARVSEALPRERVEVKRVRLARRSLGTALGLLCASHLKSSDLIYMSYPTEGYGKSLLPFVLAMGNRKRVVLHVHEYGSKNRYCRFLLRSFSGLEKIFFSNAKDFNRYVADCGLTDNPTRTAGWRVMPSPSNIPVAGGGPARSTQAVKVVHFGQIRPHKGLELLAETLTGLSRSADLQLEVIGGVPAGYEAYAEQISQRFSEAGAAVRLNLSPVEISRTLSASHVGVFAFPDGADERRGSLMAAMAHGVLCVTTHSAKTPAAIRVATIGFEVDPSMPDDLSSQKLLAALENAIEEVRGDRHQARVAAAQLAGRSATFDDLAAAVMG